MIDKEQMSLLEEMNTSYTVIEAPQLSGSAWTYIIFDAYALPAGFDVSTSNLLIRLPPGFPDAAPDMYWFDPPIKLVATGAYPPLADSFEDYSVGENELMKDRKWQRFSRHLQGGHWRPGLDDLRTWLHWIRNSLEEAVR
jgi:hypothetical protein